jgi:hypothetical protein
MSEARLYGATIRRLVRALLYALITYLLLSANTYGIVGHGVLSLAIALLAVGHRNVAIAQAAICILLLMALIPAHLTGLVP